MLQWMGGSRKKVSTTRKSIQQRQKQYFEQRRRQEELSGLVEGYRGGAKAFGQNLRQYRSLDVISLVNLATVSQQQKPDCFSAYVQEKGNSARARSDVDYRIVEEPVVVTNTDSTADPIELKDGTPSGYQVETASLNKVLHPPKNNGNTYSGITNKPQLSDAVTEQQYSLFDLLDFDEPNEHLKGKDIRESHVAFSVHGVGKIEAETPPHSPQNPDRYVSYGCFAPLKFRRQSSSSDMLSSELHEFGIEMDAMMHDFEFPLRSSMEFSNAKKDPYSRRKQNSPVMVDQPKFGDHHGEIGSSFSNRTFSATGTEVLFEGSGLFDANCIGGRKSSMLWTDEPFRTDNNSALMKYEIDEIPDYCFGGSRLQKKRFASETTESFCVSEIPASKQRIEDNYDFNMEDKSRHHSLGKDFDFSSETCKPEWSCFVTEDARDGLSSLSEESSSSTAVRDSTHGGLLSKSKPDHCRRHQHTFGSPRTKYRTRNIFTEGWHEDNRDEIEDGQNACISGRLERMPTQHKAALNLDCQFQDRSGNHLFEEGYSSPYMSTGLKSEFVTQKLPSTPSKHWTENSFVAWDQEGVADSRVPFSRPKFTDDSMKKSASASFVSENAPLIRPSNQSFSKAKLRSTILDISDHSPSYELQGRPPDSSGGALYPGENSMPDFLAQQNKNKDEAEDFSKYQQAKVKDQREVTAAKNLEPSDSLNCHENSSKYEEAKNGISDAASSVNIQDKSESDVDEKEYQYKAEVTLPCLNEHKEIEREELGGRKATTVMQRPSFFVGLSSQVMILQRHAFQLLCVQR